VPLLQPDVSEPDGAHENQAPGIQGERNMNQDTYSQLRSVDRQLGELDMAHTESVNKVTVKYQ
jgi:hypothetical protein